MISMICLPVALFLMSSFEEAVGRFHPVVLHFPIALFTAALVCDLWSYIRKKEDYTVGTWFIVAGLVSCAPTLMTGLAAAESMDLENPILIKHRSLAFMTTAFASFYAGLRISALWWKFEVPGWFYAGLSVIMVAMVSWTADFGGLITRPVTAFSTREAHQVASADIPMIRLEPTGISVDELQSKLCVSIGVSDVIPIFQVHNCQKCHANNFSDGKPLNFSQDIDPNQIFLPRGTDGKLLDIGSSNFYRAVILENTMPKGPKGKSGLSPSERLTLLLWLKNGAPME